MIDLEPIKTRRKVALRIVGQYERPNPEQTDALAASSNDVPALIAEVERLREQAREVGQITSEWLESGVERTADIWEVLAREPEAQTEPDALRQAIRERDQLHLLIVDAINRLDAAAIPLGMTEQQFNAQTILDARAILVRPLSTSTSTGDPK